MFAREKIIFLCGISSSITHIYGCAGGRVPEAHVVMVFQTNARSTTAKRCYEDVGRYLQFHIAARYIYFSCCKNHKAFSIIILAIQSFFALKNAFCDIVIRTRDVINLYFCAFKT